MEDRGHSQPLQPGVGDIAQILAHVADGESGHASAEQVFGKLRFRVDCFPQHLHDVPLELRVPEIGLLTANDVDDFEGKLEMAAFVAKDPVGAGGETVKQALGAQEVNVGECGEEKEAFDARGEADEVEQKLLAGARGFRAGRASGWSPSTSCRSRPSLQSKGCFRRRQKAAARSSGSGT